MTTAFNTTSSTKPPAAVGRQAAPTRRPSPDESADNVEATGGVAFDLVLDAMRGLARAARAGFEGRASATQVFEPVADDAHRQRQSSMQNEYRADVRDRSDDRRLQRSGVDARRQARTEASSASESARARVTPALEEARGISSRVPAPRDAETVFAKSAQREGQGDARGQSPLRFAANGEGQNGAARDAQSAAALTKPSGEARLRRPAPSGVVNSVDRGERSSGSGPALRLARVLATGRTLGAETARPTAVAAGSARASARGGAGARTPSAKPGQTSRSGPGGQDATGTSPRVGRSPFDELVQSIRLQTGTRYSSARIQLTPPELGRIQVDIRIVADRSRIEIRTENPKAKQLLERRGAELSAALERQGIALDSFEVSSETFDTGWTARSGDETYSSAEHHPQGDVSSGTSAAAREPDSGATDVALDVGADMAAMVVSETRLDIKI